MLSLATRGDYATLLDAAALQGGAAPAVIYLETGCDPIIVTREAFRQAAGRIAAALHQHGIRPGDLVIIAHTQNLESIYAFWGALLVGAIPSMFPTLTDKLDPDIYRHSMAELVRFSGVRAILTTDAFAPQLASIVDCVVLASSAIIPGEMAEISVPEAETIAFLQHSSGTTGLQKGVALTHVAVLNQLAAYSDTLRLTSEDVIVSWLPLYHDMGLIAGFLLPLVQGIPLVLMSPFDWVQHPALLFRAISDYRGTLCWLPNFAYNHLSRRTRKHDLEGISLHTMRAFINCSEPVQEDSHQQFLARFADYGLARKMLAVSYAMAENTFAVTQTPIGAYPALDVIDRETLETRQIARPASADSGDALTVVSCGSRIPGTSLRVVDDKGQPQPERQVGEFAIQSNYLLREYYHRPDLQPFVDGWYRTGDMGYLADGQAYVIGRKKDLIINAGKNVYPQDIEAIINTIDGVHPGRCVVFGVPDSREGTELIAVVAEVDDGIDRQALIKEIRMAVASQTTVSASFVTLVDAKWLVKTSSGKIARRANRDKWLKAQQS
ncbi:MAG: AMP-binding protein [Anaerolineaceae bacterium]|nr:AMP-binding protein [Anaerolineaceae bacterium]